LQNCRVVSDRLALLDYLPKAGAVAEVGVLAGDFSAEILARAQPRQLFLLDSFAADDWSWTNRFKAVDHLAFVSERFKNEIRDGRVVVRKGHSWDEIAKLENGSLDWIYIDAGHDYESTHRDLEASRPKVKDGGFIVMNDYTLFDFTQGVPYGVIHATNEFCITHGWEMVYFAFQQHMFNDVVIKELGSFSIEGMRARFKRSLRAAVLKGRRFALRESRS